MKTFQKPHQKHPGGTAVPAVDIPTHSSPSWRQWKNTGLRFLGNNHIWLIPHKLRFYIESKTGWFDLFVLSMARCRVQSLHLFKAATNEHPKLTFPTSPSSLFSECTTHKKHSSTDSKIIPVGFGETSELELVKPCRDAPLVLLNDDRVCHRFPLRCDAIFLTLEERLYSVGFMSIYITEHWWGVHWHKRGR